MAAPGFYYFFVGPALAAVLMLVINAFAIVFSSPAKQFLAIGRMRRGELQRRIPSRRYRRREGEGEEECSVCLSAFADGQRVRRLLHCGHVFHASCIDKWLMSHATCPICRADVLSPPPAIANRAVGCGV